MASSLVILWYSVCENLCVSIPVCVSCAFLWVLFFYLFSLILVCLFYLILIHSIIIIALRCLFVFLWEKGKKMRIEVSGEIGSGKIWGRGNYNHNKNLFSIKKKENGPQGMTEGLIRHHPQSHSVSTSLVSFSFNINTNFSLNMLHTLVILTQIG